MCGVVGILNLHNNETIGADVIKHMLSAIRHRGPDEVGIYNDDYIGLGHARLSIIDLSSGQQPMSNEDGTLWISFNGEIFNYIELREDLLKKGHRFKTRSDTEVIIHLYEDYGQESLHYLNGQFAFAIWDKGKRELFLARDRIGIRPLFYTCTQDRFYFSSEIKGIFALNEISREIDPVAIDQIFTFWCTIPPRTSFKGIHELPPAHFLHIKGGAITIKEYWDVDFSGEPTHLSFEDAVDSLKDILIDATRLQLRADVPVGAYLSGGLDSSAITALIRKFTSTPLQVFSVSFEDKDYDESVHQREMAEALGIEHHELICSYSDICDNFPEVIWHTEKPILRTAPVPLFLLSGLVQKHGFKVVLTGEGADEVLTGYDIFKETKIREFCARFPDSHWRPLLLRRLYPYLPSFQRQPRAYREAFFNKDISDLCNPFFSHLPRWQTTARNKLFFSDDLIGYSAAILDTDSLSDILNPDFKTWSPLARAQYIELKYLLPGYILSSQGDRVSMAHSIEGRFPFLDHRVVEFCAKLPSTYKMKGLREKYILRESMKTLLPQGIVKRTKRPYLAPDSISFFGSGKTPNYVYELLSEDCIKKYGYFNYEAVRLLVNKCKSGKAIGFKDNMAFVGILSTQILHSLFIEDFKSNL